MTDRPGATASGSTIAVGADNDVEMDGGPVKDGDMDSRGKPALPSEEMNLCQCSEPVMTCLRIMKYRLQALLAFPLLMLCGCLTYHSRIELRSSDNAVLTGSVGEIQKELGNTLATLNFQPCTHKFADQKGQALTNFFAEWNLIENRGFWLGERLTNVEMLVDGDLILIKVNAGDTGNRKGVEKIQNVIQKMIKYKFPHLKIRVEFYGNLEYPPP